MKSVWMTLLAVGALASSYGFARSEPMPTVLKEAHLGISVESVPPALHDQLPDILPNGQGVLVMTVEKDSPAGKAGLQPHDIILTFGDQKLYSPEQLVILVRAAKPGQEVALNFVHTGKPMASKVILGEYKPTTIREKIRVYRFLPDEPLRKMLEEAEAKLEDASWEGFGSMKLTRLADHRWHEEIEFQSKDGKKMTKEFTGTRDEIRTAVLADKELSIHDKNHLLRALNFQLPVFEFHFPSNLPGASDSGNRP